MMSDINDEIPIGTPCHCLHCGGNYKKGEFRAVKMRKNSLVYALHLANGMDTFWKLCPHEGCDGDTSMDCMEGESDET